MIFGIFDPIFFENFALFKKTWNRLAKENGLEGFYFYVLCQEESNLSRFNEQEYDAVVYDALQDSYKDYLRSTIKHKYHNFLVNHLKKPYVKKDLMCEKPRIRSLFVFMELCRKTYSSVL